MVDVSFWTASWVVQVAVILLVTTLWILTARSHVR